MKKKIQNAYSFIRRSSKNLGIALVVSGWMLKLGIYPKDKFNNLISEASYRQIMENGTIILPSEAPYITRTINSISEELVGASGESIFGNVNIIIHSSLYPNAYALPDGRIFITVGLLSRVNSSSHIAGVLGHEMAHIRNLDAEGHTALRLMVSGASLLMLGAFGIVPFSLAVPVLYLVEKFDQRQREYIADEYSQELIQKCGYSELEFSRFIATRISNESYLPPVDDISELTRSHPVACKRAFRILNLRKHD